MDTLRPTFFRPLRAADEKIAVLETRLSSKPIAALKQAQRTILPKAKSFEAAAPTKQKRHPASRCLSLFGGREWIRTTEARCNRFTVCPLWPLGNSPIWSWRTESNHQPADYKSAALPLSHTSDFGTARLYHIKTFLSTPFLKKIILFLHAPATPAKNQINFALFAKKL